MSHFSVCVIVPDDGVVNNIHANNLEDHLIPVLAPFDEQTEEEKYREFEDRTEEAKADFENDTMRVVRFPDGSIHSIYDDAFNKFFFVEEDKIYAFGPNRDRKSKLQTEESKALELVTDYPVKSWYPSFEAYCDEHRGFVKASDGRWGYTCNPNAKWDWWQLGGRWSDTLKLKPGCMGNRGSRSRTNSRELPRDGYCDQAQIKDVDFSMDLKAYNEAIRFWEVVVEGDDIREHENLAQFDTFYRREYYLEQFHNKERYARSYSSFTTWALVTPNGEWYENGEMGWFGMSDATDESRAEYERVLQRTLSEANPNLWISIIDCHR